MANLIYIAKETTISFGSEVGDDVAWTTESVSDGAGYLSSQHDFGSGDHADEFWFVFTTQAVATPTVLAGVRLRQGWGDGTRENHFEGTTDVAVATENLFANMQAFRTCVVTETTLGAELTIMDRVPVLNRYLQLGMWVDMGSATTADAAETKGFVTPIPPEIQ